MKIRLEKRDDGDWQADVWTPDGDDHHAIGKEPWDALIELGVYWGSLPRRRESDVETILRIVADARRADED